MANMSSQERMAEQEGRQRHQAKSQYAISLIKTDHDLVEGLFTQFEEAKGQASQQESLARQIFQALEVHSQIEEEIFYPAVRSKVYENGEDIIKESLQEHKTVKELIRQLRGLNPQDPTYMNIFQARLYPSAVGKKPLISQALCSYLGFSACRRSTEENSKTH